MKLRKIQTGEKSLGTSVTRKLEEFLFYRENRKTILSKIKFCYNPVEAEIKRRYDP